MPDAFSVRSRSRSAAFTTSSASFSARLRSRSCPLRSSATSSASFSARLRSCSCRLLLCLQKCANTMVLGCLHRFLRLLFCAYTIALANTKALCCLHLFLRLCHHHLLLLLLTLCLLPLLPSFHVRRRYRCRSFSCASAAATSIISLTFAILAIYSFSILLCTASRTSPSTNSSTHSIISKVRFFVKRKRSCTTPSCVGISSTPRSAMIARNVST